MENQEEINTQSVAAESSQAANAPSVAANHPNSETTLYAKLLGIPQDSAIFEIDLAFKKALSYGGPISSRADSPVDSLQYLRRLREAYSDFCASLAGNDSESGPSTIKELTKTESALSISPWLGSCPDCEPEDLFLSSLPEPTWEIANSPVCQVDAHRNALTPGRTALRAEIVQVRSSRFPVDYLERIDRVERDQRSDSYKDLEPEIVDLQPLPAAPDPALPHKSLPPLPKITPETVFDGALLRQIREARGMTASELCDKTKISPIHLENIEADQYALLPVTVYLRGFIVAIARELKLDPLKVAKSYLQLATKTQKNGV